MGDRCLRDRLRRVPAGRRADGRHPRPAAGLRRGLARVRTRLRCVRGRPGAAPLVAARGIQGLAAAFLEPAAFALLALAYPAGRERIRAFADLGLRRRPRRRVRDADRRRDGGASRLARRLLLERACRRVRPGTRDEAPAEQIRAGGMRVDLVGAGFSLPAPRDLLFSSERRAGALRRRRAPALCLPPRAARIRPSPQACARSTRASWIPATNGHLLPAATGSVQGAVMLGTLLLLTVTFMK